MADETIIKLTDEQKRQMKEATGQEHEELKVETVGTKLAPRVAPRRVQRLAAKKTFKGSKMAAKVAAKKPPRLAAKAAPKAGPMARKVAAKKGGMATRLAAKRAAKR